METRVMTRVQPEPERAFGSGSDAVKFDADARLELKAIDALDKAGELPNVSARGYWPTVQRKIDELRQQENQRERTSGMDQD